MPADKQQISKFKQAAREIETDDDEAAFDRNLKKLASAPPPETVEARKNTKKKAKGT